MSGVVVLSLSGVVPMPFSSILWCSTPCSLPLCRRAASLLQFQALLLPPMSSRAAAAPRCPVDFSRVLGRWRKVAEPDRWAADGRSFPLSVVRTCVVLSRMHRICRRSPSLLGVRLLAATSCTLEPRIQHDLAHAACRRGSRGAAQWHLQSENLNAIPRL